MNEIKIFENPEFGKVRTVEVDGEPYFVGKDVAIALGYKNATVALNDNVHTDDKVLTKVSTSGGKQETTLINESGLYSLIFGSKLPKAREFKHWVTSEVLPTIRKHGAYMTDEALHRAITEPDFLIKLATELKQEQEKNKALESKIQQDKPKVIFADAVETAKTSILVGDWQRYSNRTGLTSVKTGFSTA